MAYLFFSLFVFTTLSLLVSNFSETFSQLFSILAQSGGVFDRLIDALYLFGFLICLCALIFSSWNQKEGTSKKIFIAGLAILFIFLFVFGFLSYQDSALEIVFLRQSLSSNTIGWRDILVFSLMYGVFIFFPLVGLLRKRPSGPLMPSINVVLYALMGSAAQSYFHKGAWTAYFDLLVFIVALAFLITIVLREGHRFGFYEKSHLLFLTLAVGVFAFSSSLLASEGMILRYVFWIFAFVAWCLEWMSDFSGGLSGIGDKKSTLRKETLECIESAPY